MVRQWHDNLCNANYDDHFEDICNDEDHCNDLCNNDEDFDDLCNDQHYCDDLCNDLWPSSYDAVLMMRWGG